MVSIYSLFCLNLTYRSVSFARLFTLVLLLRWGDMCSMRTRILLHTGGGILRRRHRILCWTASTTISSGITGPYRQVPIRWWVAQAPASRTPRPWCQRWDRRHTHRIQPVQLRRQETMRQGCVTCMKQGGTATGSCHRRRNWN